jgi:hypothetical protein
MATISIGAALWVEQRLLVGSLKMNTALEYSTRVVQEGDRRCKKSTLNDLAYMTPLRIPIMNPVLSVRIMKIPAYGKLKGSLNNKKNLAVSIHCWSAHLARVHQMQGGGGGLSRRIYEKDLRL